MIRFRCSECQKAIGVDEKFSGRRIRCPGCQNATVVPSDANDQVFVAQAVTLPTGEATSTAKLKSIHPACPSCNSVLSNPSDAMCGICGHLLQQTPTASAPLRPISAASTAPVEAVPVGLPGSVGSLAETADTNLPVNPAISPGHLHGQPGSYTSEVVVVEPTGPTRGKSIGGWFAAVAVGMFVALICGVIAAYTGVVGQVLAWGVGALVGLIAGLVARSPTFRYCLATTLGALLCMLFGRLVSAWVIMLTVSMMSSLQGLGTYLIPDTGVSIGVTEDMSAQGEFAGDEKLLADMKVEAFFDNKTIYEMDGYDDIEYEVEVEVDRKVRNFVRKMTDEEKIAVLKRVRKDHPEWLEKSWYFNAIVDSMVNNDEIEDEDLLAHAKSVLAKIDGDSNAEYYKNTTQSEMSNREKELRKLVLKKYAEMDQDQLETAVREARLNHLSWTPLRHEYLAMLDTMYESDDIPKEYRKLAKSTINLELEFEYDESYDEEDPEREEQRRIEENELHAVVNEKLMKLDQQEIDDLVAATSEKYPFWTPDTELGALEDFAGGVDDWVSGFESDGTFWSSLKTRFKFLDFVFIALGMISAFAIAFTLGQSAKKS